MLTLLIGPVHAALLEVPATHATLEAAFADAQPGDVVQLTGDVVGGLSLPAGVTLRGGPNTRLLSGTANEVLHVVASGGRVEDLEIVAAAGKRCVRVDGQVTLEGLTCAGAQVAGGALLIHGGEASCLDCTFEDHTGPGGAPIQVEADGALVLTGGALRRNHGTWAGAIWVHSGGEVTLDGVDASENVSDGNGGVMRCNADASSCRVVGGLFHDNHAHPTAGYGGAVYSYAPFEVEGGVWTENEAGFGGAIGCGATGQCAITGADFCDNQAAAFGGAVILLDTFGTVDDSTFRRNHGVGVGGALVAYTSTVHVRGSTFVDNLLDTPVFGAAIGGYYAQRVTWWDSVFVGNTGTAPVSLQSTPEQDSGFNVYFGNTLDPTPGVGDQIADPLLFDPAAPGCDRWDLAPLDAAVAGLGDPLGDGVIGALPLIDADGDGVIDVLHPDGTDCDDTSASVNPGAVEVCNQVDDDCDGLIDQGLTYQTWFNDQDGDLVGAVGSAVLRCEAPVGEGVLVGGDCDDTDTFVFPGAPETVCDGVDQDCDGVDATAGLQFLDQDQDGWGDASMPVAGCPVGAGVPMAGDCDDADPGVHPDVADDTCDRIDQDCDGVADEDTSCEGTEPPDTDAPADTDPPDAPPASTGCGCDASGGPAGAWILALGLALGRRRAR